MRQHLIASLVSLGIAGASLAGAQDVREDLYVTDGVVRATALSLSGDTLYLGGDFGYVGPATGSWASIDATTGQPVGAFDYVEGGGVVAAVSDGVGGWYVGGSFTAVGGLPRSRLAHILANGTVGAWNPSASATVYALALNGSTLYVGGSFTSIGGQTRNNIAALDATTGNATGWNPNANFIVSKLVVSGSTVYACGSFTSIGGQTRKYLAALDATTGNATTWNPDASNQVNALVVSGSTVFVGGFFTTIGGQTRNRIAALDATTGSATAWNPNANSQVDALMVSGSTVYAGGFFSTIGGQSRNRIAALDATTGSATAWNPGANSAVETFGLSGSTVYAGGYFTTIGGQARNYIAALDVTTGNATAWDPAPQSNVLVLAVSGSTVYVGGNFISIGGRLRARIAALDVTTGHVTAWNPSANSSVYALAASGATVYAGGVFTNIGGQTRNRIAALDATTGNATAWNPNSDHYVYTLGVGGSTVYAGGLFTTIGGQTRNRIAALDATTGNATAWNPDASSDVDALAVNGSTVYVGGNFTGIGGQTRNRIAALDATTGSATAWDPNANDYVFALTVGGSTVYAGGAFTSMGGQARNRIAALDATTGNATAWNPNSDGTVYALAASGSTVYAGGVFGYIGGQTRNWIAALDAATGYAPAWNPMASGGLVFGLAVNGSAVYAGGLFTHIGGLPRPYIAGFDAVTEFASVANAALAHVGLGYGTAWGDFDEDGDQDLALANGGGPVKLFRNDTGTFVDATAGPLVTPAANRSVAWGDIDGDGDLDLFVTREGASNKLFRNDAGTFVDAPSGAAAGPGSGFSGSWADYDLDGDLDLYVGNYGQANKLFRNDSGVFVDATVGLLGDTGRTEGIAWGDYDGDGDADLYISNADTPSKLLRNDSGAFVNVSVATVGVTAEAAVWGDYDNDRDLDLYVARPGGVPNKLFRNDSGAFVDATSGPLETLARSLGVAWADYDNDGDLDLYLTKNPGPNALLRNDGGGTFVDVTAGPLGGSGTGQGLAWGDADGDGDLDLYVANSGSANLLFRNDVGTFQNWLQVNLVGVTANRSAIGTRVRVVTGSVSQIREIEGGSGFLSQNMLSAAFGLGATAQVDTLEVRWRPGVVTRLTGVAVNQRLTLQEPGIRRVPSYYPTIQAGIDAAMAGDTVLVAAGTYRGIGNHDLDFGGKNLVLVSEAMLAGPWNAWSPSNLAGQVVVDCEGVGGYGIIFLGGYTSATVVRGLAFVNGVATGVYIVVSSPSFDRCIITGYEDGGVRVFDGGSPVTFTGCTIAGNRCIGGPGGGIALSGASTVASLTRCIVWGNCATTGDDIFVGSKAAVSFTRCIVDSAGVSGPGIITYGSGHAFTNPRFCAPRSCYLAPTVGGTYTVASDSPALPANNGFGELVGALGQACVDPTVVWTGEGDGTTWQDAANWSVGVPQAGDKVVIEDLPVTSEVVYDESFVAGLLPVGEALAVAIDTLTSGEPLWVVQGTLQVMGAADVDTLVLLPGATLGGTGTVTVGVLKWRGGLMTDAGTTRVTSAMTLSTASEKSLRGGRLLESEGSWTWPGTGLLKEGDGALGTRIRNVGTLTVAGERTVDHEPLWGTTAAFENVGTAAQTVNSTFTVEAAFTNAGTIEVESGAVDLTGGLTNFSGTTLTGGTYDVVGTLRFPGADIRTSAARIVLDGVGSSIVDETDASALTQFGINGGVGDFTITNGRDLSVPVGFTNAGQLVVGPGSTFTTNGSYTQTGGGTTSGSGTLIATTMVNSGTLRPGSPLGIMAVNANYQQTATGELEIDVAGSMQGVEYDVLQVTGTAQLAGRLRVELAPSFIPHVSDAFQFLTASSVTGTFSDVRSFSIGSHVNYGATSATAVVDTLHSRFIGAPGGSWFNLANWTNGLPTALQDVLVSSSVAIDGGTAVAREVRVIGGGGSLTVMNGGIGCDTLRVRNGGILSLVQPTSQAVSRTMRLEGGAQFVWTRGTVHVYGGALTRPDGGLVVGDAPDTSTLVLSDGAVAEVGGTVTVGRDFGDRGVVRVEGMGTCLNAGTVEVGTVGRGVLRVQEGSELRTGWGGPLTPRTTVGPFGVLLGTGTVYGDVLNEGVVSPGPEPADARSGAGVGVLRIMGRYDQTSGGVLEMEMGGTHSGGFDRLEVTGQARLSGTLRLVRLFQMSALPDTAEVLRYVAPEGMFGSVTMVKAASDDAITATLGYGATALRLVLAGTMGQVGVEPQAPKLFRVYPNFPNPFRSATTIQFDLPVRAEVKLRIYDLQGRLVRTLLGNEPMEPGAHTRLWQGEDEQGHRVASGVYFYRLEAGRDRQVRRMVKLQ